MAQFLRTESFGAFLRLYPITSVLIAINLFLFLLLTLFGGSTNPWTLEMFGAFNRQWVLEGDWYRFITAAFLHHGFGHLLFNMFVMIVFVVELERILGPLRFLLFYLLSAVGASLVTFFFAPYAVVVGASGAIFGVFGAFLFMIRYRPEFMSMRARQTILPLIVINLIFTFIDANTSITGHIGGFVSGFLLSFLFIGRFR